MAELILGQQTGAVLQWQTAAGSVSLLGDFRTVDWSPSTGYTEVTAGTDTQVGRLPTVKDATCSVTLITQTAGTQIAAYLLPQTAGTLTIGPEGTATGKRKITLPAYSDGAKFSFPYEDVATISIQFSGSSTLGTFSDSTY